MNIYILSNRNIRFALLSALFLVPVFLPALSSASPLLPARMLAVDLQEDIRDYGPVYNDRDREDSAADMFIIPPRLPDTTLDFAHKEA